MVDGGETIGGLNVKPRGVPVSSTPFPELVNNPAAMSWAENRPERGPTVGALPPFFTIAA